MDRYWADRIAVGIVGAVLLIGLLWSWNASQQSTMTDGMMGSMMNGGTTYGTDPLVYLFGGVLLAVVLGAGYVLTREQLTPAAGADRQSDSQPLEAPDQTAGDVPTGGSDFETTPNDATTEPGASGTERASADIGGDLLRYLPEDERRVLEPVIKSPGLTQIEIRDRSDFSKSKVSQTLSELEERGLVAREKQGRTYRVTPGPELEETDVGS